MITNTTQGQKSPALLLDEIEKDAKEDESLCSYALTTVPLLVKALRRAMQALEEPEPSSEVTHVRQKLRDARSLADAYTFAKPCCVSDTPDAHTIWIKVGNQSFSIDGYQDTLAEANWMRFMLGKAIQAILSEHFNVAGALPLSPKVLSEITAILEGKEQEKDSGEPGAAHTKETTSDS